MDFDTSCLIVLLTAIVIPLGFSLAPLWKRRRRYLAFQTQMKHYEDTNFFTGDAKHLQFNHESMWTSLKRSEDFWPISCLWLGPFHMGVETANPDFIKELLRNARDRKDPLAYNWVKPWIGEGLLVSSGEKWERNRRLLTPAFHFENLKSYLNVMCDSTRFLMESWERRLDTGVTSFDVCEDTSRLSLDILLKCIFGSEQHILETRAGELYLQSIKILCDGIVRRFKQPYLMIDFLFYMTPIGRAFRKACDQVHEFSRATLKERRDWLSHQRSPQAPKEVYRMRGLSFIDILITAKDDTGKGLTDEEILSECDTFMFEGHDTTSAALSWVLHRLACHQDMQDRCRQEVLSVMGEDSVLEYADLDRLVYTTMFIKECLRIHPPVPSVGRELASDIDLPGGVHVPAGTTAWISPWTIHMNSQNWCEPDVFNPERFSSNAESKRHPYSYIPFSAGPRNCIGRHFAMNELKASTCLILSKFRVHTDETKPPPRYLPHIVLRAEKGIWIRVEPI